MQFLRRALSGVFLLCISLGLLAWAGGTFYGAVQERMAREANQRPPRERVVAVNTVPVEIATIAPMLDVFGEVRSRRTLEVRAQTGGRIVFLDPAFEDGATVEQGSLLARIDPADAEFTLANARTDQTEAEAELRDAQRAEALAADELNAAQAQADLRMQALERQQDLAQRGVGTTAAVETAALAESSAQQAVLARRIALASAEARVDQARTRLERSAIALQDAERDLEDTEVRAAFSGTLDDVIPVEGGLVTANERLANLIDPRDLEVAVRLSTAQYARLLTGSGDITAAPVKVTLDVAGLDLSAAGEVSRVSASVGEGQTGRRVFAHLDDSRGFRPGDFVSVQIQEPALDGVARVPATAVDAFDTVLIIGPDERLAALPVELVRRQGDDVLIRAPALSGQRIVAERTPLVGPGIKVRDLSAERSQRMASASGTAGATGDETIELTDERRAALIAAVESNSRMPAEAKARVLDQLQQDSVPARMVQRIESRAGG